jgi:hypothetical protein
MLWILMLVAFGQTSQPATQPVLRPELNTGFVYLGKPRTVRWFEWAYERFAPQLDISTGRCVDVGRAILRRRIVLADGAPEEGVLYLLPRGSSVYRTFDGSMLVDVGTPPGFPKHTIRLTGIAAENFATNMEVWGNVIYEGIHQYSTESGRRLGIHSFRIVIHPTRDEFAKALRNGLKLVDHRKVERKRRGRVFYEVVDTPIP